MLFDQPVTYSTTMAMNAMAKMTTVRIRCFLILDEAGVISIGSRLFCSMNT